MVPAAGLAMGSCPTCFLVLVLCLGQTIHMQERILPKPSIRAEPGPVIHWGRPVSIVCRAASWVDLFRLEKDGTSVHMDQKNVSQHGHHWAEAEFHINAVNESTAGSYWCLYHKGPGRSDWSERSEPLELKVTGAPRVISSTSLTPTKPLSTAESSTTRAAVQGTGHMQTNSPDTKNKAPQGLSQEHLFILAGVCVAFLLCLLLLILLLVHRQHQKKRGPPSSKGEEPRPQERLTPTADITDSPADVATTVDALPEENGDMHGPSPAAGDPQEVTYAQLDQRALTRRAARAESPRPMEPTAESSTYATLPRH